MSRELSQVSSITDREGDGAITSNQSVNVSLKPYRVPQLPVEVYELVIDWLVILIGTGSYGERREMVERLSTCSIVCRAWRIRAQAHLFKRVHLNYERLPYLDRVLKDNAAIRSVVTEMHVMGRSKAILISFFAIRHQLPNLTYLNLNRLDLTREHQWLRRAPLFHSIQRLMLRMLQTCQLSQLVLFINSFPALARLELDLDFNELKHRNQILPKPFPVNTPSLTWLELELKPGVWRLIDWLLQTKPLLSNLKTLVLTMYMIKEEVELISAFEGIRELLHSCHSSIEDLRLHLDRVPMVESVSDIVRLDLLPNLRHLTYGSPTRPYVLPYAVHQLQAVTSTKHKPIKVTFDMDMDNTENQLDTDTCKIVDDLLSGDKFPSLENVFLHKSVAAILFPKLSQAGLLRNLPYADSHWASGPRLPTHLCEGIIGWVYYGTVESKWEWNGWIKALIACSLVCHKWRVYAETYLSKPIQVPYEELTFFSDALAKDQRLLSVVRRLEVVKGFQATPISLFATQHQFRHLNYLNIHDLDLTREHRWLYRAPLFRSVRELRLYHLRACQFSQLIRFINSFPSLFKLELDFDFSELQYRGQILPRPYRSEMRALTWLQLDLKPGVSRLIDWFLIAEPFLAQLKTLVLYIWNIPDKDVFTSIFMGVERLLGRCRNSVEDFRLHLDRVPTVECLSNLVELDSFPNLKYITYGSYVKDAVLPYAIRQLGAITSRSSLIQVDFDLSLDYKNKPDEELCKTLDGLLTGPTFPSLQIVGLRRTIHPELFPQLNAAGRLMVLDQSFWLDPPVTAEELGSDGSGEGNSKNDVEGEKGGEHIRDTAEEENDGSDITSTDDEHPPLALPENYD